MVEAKISTRNPIVFLIAHESFLKTFAWSNLGVEGQGQGRQKLMLAEDLHYSTLTKQNSLKYGKTWISTRTKKNLQIVDVHRTSIPSLIYWRIDPQTKSGMKLLCSTVMLKYVEATQLWEGCNIKELTLALPGTEFQSSSSIWLLHGRKNRKVN